MSLYDLIHLRPEEAEKRLTFEDYFDYGIMGDSECNIDDEYQEVCILHLCEKMSKRFFREWALEAFLELTHNRLPILCGEMIIENLMNEDLWNICLAAESTIHEDNVIKCNNKRTRRVRKASKKQKLD
uniref:Uncharacterized protein n=1 Tax=Trichogramma kaykai TaxID=54128 RepID=A0ABD2XN92_9HYME